MTKTEHLYLKLMEECAEVQKRASKLMQFGPHEVEPGHDKSNLERLKLEVNDLLTMIGMLEGNELLPVDEEGDLLAHARAKKLKIEKYLAYSQELGMVER